MDPLSHAQNSYGPAGQSIDSQVSKHLSVIDNYTRDPDSVTSEAVHHAFDSIEKFVTNRQALGQISMTNLVTIHQEFADYARTKPTQSKVAQTFVDFAGKNRKERIVKTTLPRVESEIQRIKSDVQNDREQKGTALGPVVRDLAKLPERELRPALRTLLMDLSHGQFGHPIPLSEASDLVLKHVGRGSLVEDLLFDPRLFSLGSAVRDLSNLSEEEARPALRTLLMGLCHGQFGHPMPLEEATASIRGWAEEISKEASYEESPVEALLADPTLFSLHEYKTGRLVETPPKDLGLCIQGKFEAGELTLTPPQSADHKIQELKQQRLFSLNNLETVYQKTTENPDQRINSKFFPQTRAWYVGSTHREGIAPFELEMQRIGREHNIPVITDSKTPLSQENGAVLSFNQPMSATYPQDYVDFTQNEVRVPVVINPERAAEIQGKIQDARVARDPDWAIRNLEGISVNPASQVFGIVGEPMGKSLQAKAVDLASALDATPVMNLTYSEGGNTLTGTNQDGSMYVIIGQDSYVASKLLMEEDLGRPMTDPEVRMAFAIDYGVRVENLHFVEQPGDFHLDMNIAIVGEKTVVVNDALEAERVFAPDNTEILREKKLLGQEKTVETRSKAASIQKKLFEDKAAQNLQDQGFTVLRSAGRFELQTPFGRHPKMNFYNMVTATTPAGKRIVIAMGVTNDEYKDRFRTMLTSGGLKVDHIYFLNADDTAQSLEMHGGISCRAKTI